MKVSLANALGTCFGVKDAIDLAMDPEFKSSLTIIGQLVHNPQVSESLNKNGVSLVNGIDELDNIKTKMVMITAHGASDRIKDKLQDEGFILFDASCPLVMRVHQVIKSMVKDNYFPVVIGQETHVEVKGIVGDLEEYLVINNEEDIDKLREIGKRKIGIVSQTTSRWKRSNLSRQRSVKWTASTRLSLSTPSASPRATARLRSGNWPTRWTL